LWLVVVCRAFYARDVFFALIFDDTLYFKVDDSTRPEFEARGMAPFRLIFSTTPKCWGKGPSRRSRWLDGPNGTVAAGVAAKGGR
jgi:TfoX-like protein